jgi:group I intron endonuclease
MYFEIPSEHKNSSGIYSITNIINGKRLIGSTGCFARRFRLYKSDLNTGDYQNKYFQNSYNKYGTDSFKFELINLCPKENLIELEDYYMAAFNTMDRNYGYNLQTANRKTMTDAIKKKIGDSNRGKPRSQELRERLRAANTGKKQSVETIDKRVRTFKKLLNELCHGWNLGSKHSPEANLAKSIRQTGIKSSTIYTPEIRNNMSLGAIERYKKNPKPSKPVFQFSKDGLLLNKFSNNKDAEQYLKKPKNCLRNVLCGKKPTAYGFRWSYSENLNNGETCRSQV